MKCKRTQIVKDKAGDVGIGTLIIFIAIVLVAAVAAAVLIQTSGILQQKAQQTGKEATQEVGSNIKIVSILGVSDVVPNPTRIVDIYITIQLSAGGNDIDMTKVKVNYITDTDSKIFNDWDSLVEPRFVYWEDRSITGGNNQVLQPGDLGVIRVYLVAYGMQMDPRAKHQIHIIPETGTMTIKEFTAPATLGETPIGMIKLFP